jgi:hypothetical protein
MMTLSEEGMQGLIPAKGNTLSLFHLSSQACLTIYGVQAGCNHTSLVVSNLALARFHVISERTRS